MISTLFNSLRARFRTQQQSTSLTDSSIQSMETAHLLILPIDIITYIAQSCSTADVKRLCETCHYLHDACMLELYRVIDLGSHNADISTEPIGIAYHRVPPHFINRKWTQLDYNILQKQKAYIHTLDARPELGEYTRDMHWTFLDLEYVPGENWDDEDFEDKLEKEGDPYGYGALRKSFETYSEVDRSCRCELKLEVFTQRSKSVWRTFQNFTKVSSIDICWLRWGREIFLPEPMFPAAKSVRLSGCMTRGLVERILEWPSRQLEKLELENLGQRLEIQPPLPRFNNVKDFAKYWREHKSGHEMIEDTHLMVCDLDPFLGCTTLTSLTITTVGLHKDDNLNSWDDRRYLAWARFIASVRGSLSYFAFKQGVSRNQIAPPRGRRLCLLPRPSPPPQDHRPMDRLFRQWLVPTLLEAPWPRIQRMEIRGVGRYTWEEVREQVPTEEERMAEADVEYEVRPEVRDPSLPTRSPRYCITISRIAFHKAAQETLLDLLPDGAELVVDEEPERDYEDFIEFTPNRYDERGFVGFLSLYDDCCCW